MSAAAPFLFAALVYVIYFGGVMLLILAAFGVRHLWIHSRRRRGAFARGGQLPDVVFDQFREPFTEDDERRFFEEWVRS
jgi:hypothetical protein